LLKEKFVCVAVDARKESSQYQDAEGDFIRTTRSVTTTASGSVCVVTAGGKRLTNVGGPGQGMIPFLQAGLKAWAELPEAERKPGAVSIPKTERVDPKRTALTLPPGALVLRVFNRHLGRDEKQELRYAVPEDFLPGTSKVQAARFAEAHNDFMWVPEKEWQALVPAELRPGASHDVPVSLALRLFRFHLDPSRGFSEGAAFTGTRSDAGRLTLTVQEVTPERLVLRLQGHARLRQEGRSEPSVYEPALLGYLEYDRAKKSFTRFDVVALGTASGLPRDANGVVTPRKGAYPLGIAFELVRDPTPAERLYPRGARDNPAAYLEPREKP
jgi:hypothetical protein